MSIRSMEVLTEANRAKILDWVEDIPENNLTNQEEKELLDDLKDLYLTRQAAGMAMTLSSVADMIATSLKKDMINWVIFRASGYFSVEEAMRRRRMYSRYLGWEQYGTKR